MPIVEGQKTERFDKNNLLDSNILCERIRRIFAWFLLSLTLVYNKYIKEKQRERHAKTSKN